MTVGRVFSCLCFSGPRKRRASEVELDKLDEKSQIVVLKNFKSLEEYEDLRAEHTRLYDILDDLRAEHTRLERIQDENVHLQLERQQVFKDALVLYERGIVELELNVFIYSEPEHHLSPNRKSFRCGSTNIDINFTSVLRHWCQCPVILRSIQWETEFNQVCYACFLFVRLFIVFPWLFRLRFDFKLRNSKCRAPFTLSIVFCPRQSISMPERFPSRFIV